MAHKFGSRGGHVIRVTAGGNAVYGSPADKKPTNLGKLAKAALTVGAGIVAAGALGGVAGKIARAGATAQNVGNDIKLLKGIARAGRGAKLEKFAIKNAYLQKALDRAHDITRYGAASIGTVIIDKGVNDALDATGSKSSTAITAGVGASTAAALLATRTAEGMSLSPSAAVALRNALKKLKKPIGKPF